LEISWEEVRAKWSTGKVRVKQGTELGECAFTRSIVFTYSENTAQYSLLPPKVRRMKKAPDILSSSPTTFIPRKSAARQGSRGIHL
jgi:hypothetical protein